MDNEEKTWYGLTFDQVCEGAPIPKGLYVIYYDIDKIPLEEVANSFKRIQAKLGFQRELIALPTGNSLKYFEYEDLIKIKNDFNNLIDYYIEQTRTIGNAMNEVMK